MRKLALILFIFLIGTGKIYSQLDNEFWIAVPYATPSHNPPVKSKLVVSMLEFADTVIITQPANPGFVPIVLPVPAFETRTADFFALGLVNVISDEAVNAITNAALFIYSKNGMDFNAYFEIYTNNNPDIFTLKGENALGYDFFIPFQDQWNNQNWGTNPAYSSFDIVATKDNTEVTIYLTKEDFAGNAANSSYTITLNQGETYSVAPRMLADNNPSDLKADRLVGCRVRSNQPVAITDRDDSVRKQGAYDMIGDQIVPLINISGDYLIGHDYIVMKGQVDSDNGGERVYFLATQDNTDVFIDGVKVNAVPLMQGEQYSYQIPNAANKIYVSGTKPIYTYHIAGFGDELGGALIPSVDGCTGSLSTSFVRSMNQPFFLSLMTKSNAIDSFYVATAVDTFNIPGSWFEQVGTTDWYVLMKDKKEWTNLAQINIPLNQVTRVYNTEDVFHLGTINGVTTGGGCRYGYFSNYNAPKPAALTISSGTGFITGCELDSVQLKARGGLLNNYLWSPTEYIDDPTSPTPIVNPPIGWTDFYVQIKQPCDGFETKKVTIINSPNPHAFYISGKSKGCSPFTVNIERKTEGADTYVWKFGDGSPLSFTTDSIFSHTYTNNTDSAVTYLLELSCSNADGCSDYHAQEITVYPAVASSFSVPDTAGCHPYTVSFTNTSSSNGPINRYEWYFGDGGTSTDTNPARDFQNFNVDDTIYNTEMIAFSPFNPMCNDTSTQEILVHPYLNASFTIDTVEKCSPLKVRIHNTTTGGKNFYWDLSDSVFSTTNSTDVIERTYHNPTAVPDTIIIRLRARNEGGAACEQWFQRQLIVYPEVNASYVPNKPLPIDICDSINITFNNTSTGYNLQYKWEFGDGGSSAQTSPHHIFYNRSDNDQVYDVVLTATSIGNRYCTDTYSLPVTVHPYVKADFTMDQKSNCTPFPVTLENPSIRGDRYDWDFDNNGTVDTSTFNELPFEHVFTNAHPSNSRIYNVRMRASNFEGCYSEIIKSIEVFPRVVASFDADVTEGCHPLQVEFTQQSTGGSLLYKWDFKDSTSSTTSAGTFDHTFNNFSSADRTFNVTLTATNPNGCISTHTLPITSYAFIESNFTLASAEDCSPFPVTPSNQSEGGITGYSWDFDGYVSASANPSHTYVNKTLATNIHPLRLIVQNSHGCTDTLIRNVTVYPEVVSAFAADITEGCNPIAVQFTNNSNTPVAYTYQWDFKDGASSSEQNPGHTFSHMKNTDQVYPVSLRSISEFGCYHDTALNIISYAYINADYAVAKAEGCSPKSVTITNASAGGIANYAWDFGDGTTQNNAASTPPAHTYTNKSLNVNTHPLRLVVKNNHNCFDTLIRNITVYPEVVSRFSADVTEGCNPLQVQFTSNSNIPVSTIYQWDFKDGASSDQKNPDHTFTHLQNTDQVYPVSLRSVSDYGCYHDTILNITAYAHIKADFALGKADGCSPFSIGLRNASAGGISTYAWDFGDGSQAASRTPTHTYLNQTQNVITNPIRLIVKNAHNCFDTIIKNATIYPEVTADFEVDSGGCHPLTLPFSNTSNLGDNFEWSFGDGSSSAAVAPTHLYNNYTPNDITHTVKLVATSRYTCNDSISKNITVYHKPKAKFQVDRLIDCPPFNLDIENSSQSHQSTYFWDFDDGSFDTVVTKQTMNHTFDNLPDNPDNRPYTISLYAETNHGCNDDYELTINVYPRVTANFKFDTAGCSPYDLPFENLSTNADEYYWDFGDEMQSKQEAPYHVFFSTDNYNPQEFDIYLRSTSVEGCTDDTAGHITVYPSPIADFSVTPTLRYFGFEGAEFTIYNDTEEGNWDYEWSYDNGDSAYVKDPTPYNYDHWGSYDITLNAYTEHCSNSISQPIIILPPIPYAHFDSSYSACAPVEMNFRNNSLWGNSYLWEFDDDQVSTEQHPTHVFDTAGIYNIKLTVEGDGGKAYHYETITVYPNPAAEFAIEPQNVMLPDAIVKCYSTSKLADNHYWTFGDGKVSSEEHPEHLYDALGAYDVSLTVWTENGCRDSLFLKEAVLVEGEGLLEFPNAFTPNLSGPADPYYDPSDLNNDVFFPVHEGVKEIHLEVYSRWGELIFTTDDVNQGWNGYFNGKLVPQAVYVWKAKGTFYNGKPFNKAGDVTVLHNPMNPGQ